MKDIVCGMEVSDDSAYHHEHGGKVFYFCSKDCLREFSKNSEQYLNKEALAPEHPADGSTNLHLSHAPGDQAAHSRQLPQVRYDFVTRRSTATHNQNRLCMPDAPGDPTVHAGQLPQVRYGAGAALRGGGKSRTRRHDTAFLGLHGTGYTCICARHDGRSSAGIVV